MNGDHALMNRDQDQGYNLAVGEPVFLQKLVARRNIQLTAFEVRSSFPYPSPQGDPLLLAQLGQMYPGKHVIITQGAKGGVYALMRVFKEMHKRLESVHHTPTPYWPTHKTLAHLTGFDWLAYPTPMADSLTILTSPNNPNGQLAGLATADIWDAAYASPIYGWNLVVPFNVASVFSAAKLYGLSGYRVGWVVTGNAIIAEKLKLFIEATSSGVSRIAQRSLACLLRYWENTPEDRLEFEIDARAELLSTARLYNVAVDGAFDKVEGCPETGLGMYAWIRLRDRERFDRALKNAGARVLGGEFCGASQDWVRMTCGLGYEKTKEGLRAVSNAYNYL